MSLLLLAQVLSFLTWIVRAKLFSLLWLTGFSYMLNRIGSGGGGVGGGGAAFLLFFRHWLYLFWFAEALIR